MAQFNLVLSATDMGFTATLKKAEQQLVFTRLKVEMMNSAMQAVRTSAMMGVGSLAAMAIPAMLATKAVGGFEASLRRAAAIGGGDWSDSLDEMTEKIVNLSTTFGVSAEEIAVGMVDFAKAGFDVSIVLNEILTPAVQMATINQVEFGKASEIATAAWQLFGNQVDSAEELFNKMHVAANESLMDIEDMTSAIQYAGSAFVLADVPVEEFLASVAAMSQLAQTSQQNLGTLISRLIVSGGEMESIFGVSPGTIVSEGKVNMQGFVNVLRETALTEEQITRITELWGVRSFKTFAGMYKSGGEFFRILEAINQAEGELGETAVEMSFSLESMITRIMESIKSGLYAPEVIDNIRTAFERFLTVVEESNLSGIIAKYVITAMEFLTENADELIELGEDVLTLFVGLAPTIIGTAKAFVAVADALTVMGPLGASVLTTMFLMKKIIPTDLLLLAATAYRIGQVADASNDAAISTNKYMIAMVQKEKVEALNNLSTRIYVDSIYAQVAAEVNLARTKQHNELLSRNALNWKGREIHQKHLDELAQERLTLATNRYKDALVQVQLAKRLFGEHSQQAKDIAASAREYGNYVNELEKGTIAEQRHGVIAAFEGSRLSDKIIKRRLDALATREQTQATKEQDLATQHLNETEKMHTQTTTLFARTIGKLTIEEQKLAYVTQTIMASAIASVSSVMFAFQQDASTTVKVLTVLAAALNIAATAFMVLGAMQQLRHGVAGIVLAGIVMAAGISMMGAMVLSGREQSKNLEASIEASKNNAASMTFDELQSRETGGYIENTEPYLLHEGEYVLPADEVERLVAATERDPASVLPSQLVDLLFSKAYKDAILSLYPKMSGGPAKRKILGLAARSPPEDIDMEALYRIYPELRSLNEEMAELDKPRYAWSKYSESVKAYASYKENVSQYIGTFYDALAKNLEGIGGRQKYMDKHGDIHWIDFDLKDIGEKEKQRLINLWLESQSPYFAPSDYGQVPTGTTRYQYPSGEFGTRTYNDYRYVNVYSPTESELKRLLYEAGVFQ